MCDISHMNYDKIFDFKFTMSVPQQYLGFFIQNIISKIGMIAVRNKLQGLDSRSDPLAIGSGVNV